MKAVDQFFILLATMPWGRALLAGLFAAAIYYFGIFNDGAAFQTGIEKTAQQIKEIERQIRETKEAVANADRFEKEVKARVDQFSRIVDYMPEKINASELTTLVSDLSTKAGLKLTKTEPRAGVDRTAFYETTRLNFSLDGSFSQVVMFLSYLSQVRKLFTFDKIEVASTLNADIEMPKLAFSGILVGYRYVKQNQAAGGEPGAAKPAPGQKPGQKPGAAGGGSGNR